MSAKKKKHSHAFCTMWSAGHTAEMKFFKWTPTQKATISIVIYYIYSVIIPTTIQLFIVIINTYETYFHKRKTTITIYLTEIDFQY